MLSLARTFCALVLAIEVVKAVPLTNESLVAPNLDHLFNDSSGISAPHLKLRDIESSDHALRVKDSSRQLRCGGKNNACSDQSCGSKALPRRRHLAHQNLNKRDLTPTSTLTSHPKPSRHSTSLKPTQSEAIWARYDRLMGALDKRARILDDDDTYTEYTSTSMWGRWQGPENAVGADGLFGCTVLMVLSRHGYYVAHFWEVPSFFFPAGSTSISAKPIWTQDQQDAFFVETVLKPLIEGRTQEYLGQLQMEPLTNMTKATLPDGGPGPLFPSDEPVNAYIFSPESFEQRQPRQFEFQRYVSALHGAVSKALGGRHVGVEPYMRSYWWQDCPRPPVDDMKFADYPPYARWLEDTAVGKVFGLYRRAGGKEGYELLGPRDYMNRPVAVDEWTS